MKKITALLILILFLPITCNPDPNRTESKIDFIEMDENYSLRI